MSQQTPMQPAPGWYDDGSGRQRWWDGHAWQMYAPAQPTHQQHHYGPMTAGNMNVRREVVYNRQQTGHSLTLWIILSMFFVVPIVGLIYYSASPNHYWHA